MIEFPVDDWHVMSIDQSIAAAIRFKQTNYPHKNGVTVRATAHGARMDLFIDMIKDPTQEFEVGELPEIHAIGYGATYMDAYVNAAQRAREIEETDPLSKYA